MGCEQAVCVLPLGSAKAFHRTIHRMVRLHCLLTSLGGTLCVPLPFRGTLSPVPPAAFEKAGETFNAYGPFTLGYGPFTFGIVR